MCSGIVPQVFHSIDRTVNDYSRFFQFPCGVKFPYLPGSGYLSSHASCSLPQSPACCIDLPSGQSMFMTSSSLPSYSNQLCSPMHISLIQLLMEMAGINADGDFRMYIFDSVGPLRTHHIFPDLHTLIYQTRNLLGHVGSRIRSFCKGSDSHFLLSLVMRRSGNIAFRV